MASSVEPPDQNIFYDKYCHPRDSAALALEKRFKALHISSTEENRCGYRELLFTTPELNEFISGTILFDETIRQKTRDGIPFSEFLAKQGIVPESKVEQHSYDAAGNHTYETRIQSWKSD